MVIGALVAVQFEFDHLNITQQLNLGMPWKLDRRLCLRCAL